MAFTPETLSGNIGAGSNAPSFYTYSTADTKAAVVAADYFLPLAAQKTVRVNDLILAVCSDGVQQVRVLTASLTAITTEAVWQNT